MQKMTDAAPKGQATVTVRYREGGRVWHYPQASAAEAKRLVARMRAAGFTAFAFRGAA